FRVLPRLLGRMDPLGRCVGPAVGGGEHRVVAVAAGLAAMAAVTGPLPLHGVFVPRRPRLRAPLYVEPVGMDRAVAADVVLLRVLRPWRYGMRGGQVLLGDHLGGQPGDLGPGAAGDPRLP